MSHSRKPGGERTREPSPERNSAFTRRTVKKKEERDPSAIYKKKRRLSGGGVWILVDTKCTDEKEIAREQEREREREKTSARESNRKQEYPLLETATEREEM